MSEPTAYDLEQDQIISEHSELLTVSDVAASGNQISYPVVGQPMSESMWGNVTRGIGNGILDTGDSPYYMPLSSLDNATNTGVLKTGRITGESNAIINGFYHQLTEDQVVSIPPVSVTTTYHICLTFDPLLAQSATGPITLQTYAGLPPKSGGKTHIVLYEVLRRPNTVLTDATFTNRRARITPQIYVAYESELPDPAGHLWGTIATVHTTGEQFIAVSSGNNSGPTEWKNITALAMEKYANIIVINGQNYRRSGKQNITMKINGAAGSIWYGEQTVVLPKPAPDGWEYQLTATGKPTILWLGSVTNVNGAVHTIRICSFSDSIREATIHWQLVESA